jgi:hypothetical protein
MTDRLQLAGSSTSPQAASRRRRVTVAVLLTALLLAGWWMYRSYSPPNIGEPFDVAEFTSYSVSDEQNASTYYWQAINLSVEPKLRSSGSSLKPETFAESFDATLERGWGHAIPAIRKWVEGNGGMLAELKQGARCEQCLQVLPNDFRKAGELVGKWNRLRNCLQVQDLEGLKLTSEHHPAEAWACFRDSIRASRHLAMRANSLQAIVGAGVLGDALKGAILWSADPAVGPADLKRAIRDLLTIEDMHAPASDQIKIEYLALREAASNGTVFGKPVSLWVRSLGYPAQSGLCARLVVANLLSQADRPRYQRTPVHPGPLHLFELDPSAPDPQLLPPERIEAECINSAETLADDVRRFSPTAAAQLKAYDPKRQLGSLWKAILWSDIAQAKRSALLLTMALELYQREHGDFPATLNELVAKGYLKSIPADPFGKGEPYHYVREARATSGARLWSVYTDGVGKGDLVFYVPVPGKSSEPKK